MTIRLYLFQPTTKFAARVNQSVFNYPLAECEFDGVTTGAYGDIEVGMTVLFGTSAGDDDLGRQRIRLAADSNTVNFGLSSQGIRDGEVKLQDNAYITVLNDFRVWAKVPRAYTNPDGTITWYKDELFVDSLTDANIPPVANAGVGFADTIDSGTSKITASWDASTNSFAVTDGESISSYLWDVDDGTITVGTTATAAITATFPAGFRWVKLTVTDSNSQTHTTRMPVYGRNPANDTTIGAFTIDNHRITPQGQEISLRIREAIGENIYPDGTLVMLWEGVAASASDRSHMVFIGWHHTDPAAIASKRTGILRDTILECRDVAGKLDALPGFIQSITSKVGPTRWTDMSTPNMDKYLHYLLQWHSTALDLADWTDSGTGTDFPFVALGSDGESLFDQVDRRARALVPDYQLTCNTLGQMAVTVDPMLQDTGDRTATIQTSLGDADWTNLQYTHQRHPRAHWLRGNAIDADTSVISALFCIAPGDSPGQGEIAQEQGEQLAQNQTDLNACEGHRYARINAPESVFNITLTEGDDKDIEPADMTWVRLTISPGGQAAQRGLTFSNERGLVQEMNIRYNHARTGLVKTVDLTWERETSGTAAVTVIIPEMNDPVEYNPPDPDPDPGPTDPVLAGDGFGTAYAMTSNTLGRTRDLGASSPAWTSVGPTGGYTFLDFMLDPWAPTTTGYLSTTNGLYKSTSLQLTSPSWSLVLTPAEAITGISGIVNSPSNYSNAYKVFGSINSEDYIWLFFQADHVGVYRTSKNVYCAYSINGGSTWSYARASTHQEGVGPSQDDTIALWYGAVDLVPWIVSGNHYLYILYGNTGQVTTINQSRRSTDGGATWHSGIVFGGSGMCKGISCPYDDNESGLVVYGASDLDIKKSTDGIGTWSSVQSGGGSTLKRWGIETYTQDEQVGYLWRNNVIKTTDDAFSTLDTPALTGLSGTPWASGGFPYDNQQFYCLTSTGIFVSVNRGENWINKTGDWSFGFTGNRASVIVPVWVEE